MEMINMQKHICAFLVFCLSFFGATTLLCYGQGPKKSLNGNQRVKGKIVTKGRPEDSAPLNLERELNEKIKAALSPVDSAGEARKRKETTWIEIDIRGVALKVLAKNLSILRAKGQKRIAEAALRQAKAVFDPRAQFSATVDETEITKREEKVKKWNKNTVPLSGTSPYSTDPDPIFTIYPDISPIAYLKFNKERKEGHYPKQVTASEPPLWGPTQSNSYEMNLTKPIPWGLTLDLSLKAVDKESYWMNEDKSWGSYDRPWRSTFRETLSIPVPGGKDFGPNHTEGTLIKEAELEGKSAEREVQATVNRTLLDAETAYWELVANMRAMHAVMKHRGLMKSLLQKTEVLYGDRMVTEYDLVQVKTELSASREREQQARNAFVTSSNRINELLSAERSMIFLPVGYTSLLVEDPSPLPEEERARNLEDNPELMKQLVKIESAKISLNYAMLQARPDIKFEQTLTWSQDYSVYGFHSVRDSVWEAFASPDLVQQDYSLAYQYPFLNRAAHSASKQAKLNGKKQQILYDLIRRRVLREVSDALVGLSSTRARIAITRKSLELAQLAYRKATERQESREITEYEVVIKASDLLGAELDAISAQIENKKAEIRLLGALGKLAKRYASKVKGS
jgi:outer membrane protein TolC